MEQYAVRDKVKKATLTAGYLGNRSCDEQTKNVPAQTMSGGIIELERGSGKDLRRVRVVEKIILF